jgi:hypothetical protein
MSDYIKELEKQNEELKEKLAAREAEVEDLAAQLDSALEDVSYYRERANEANERDWNSP